MSEWDKKFSRMVAETERHLASVKRQLRSPSGAVSSGSVRTTPRRNVGSPSPYLSHTSPTSILRSYTEKPTGTLSSLMNVPSPPAKRNVSFDVAPPISGGSAGISLLGEKIRSQQKDIIALRESLTGMQSYLKQQHNQIMSLKDEMHTLQLKLSESVWSRREDVKLQQFKKEVSSELETLKKRMQNFSAGTSGGCVNSRDAFSLSDENKLRRSDVVTSLHRELSNFKSKLATQGSKVGNMASELREMKQKQENVSKMASEVEEWRRTEGVLNSRRRGVVTEQNSQLQRLRDLLSSLERRLQTVEDSSFPASSTKTTPPSNRAHQSHATNRHAHIGMVASTPMSMSDLGVSPIGVAAAAKFHPAHGKGVKLIKTKPNPLFMAPPTLKYTAGHTDLMSEGSDTGSDLDGHTLSCSLELMSDFEVTDSVNLNSSDTDDTISLSNLIR